MIAAFLTLALAAETPPCLDRAVARLRVDPNGFHVYRALDDREAFGFWLDCDSPDDDVSSAVHESVHLLSGGPDPERYRFWLVGADVVEVPLVPTPPRSLAVEGLRADERDSYVETYLTGRSGAQGLEVLLDELNAYAHGLTTETALAKKKRTDDGRQTGARDGVAHFLLYLTLYLEQVEAADPDRFRSLGESHGEVVAILWKQAEAAVAASWPYPALGIDDRWYLARAFHPDRLAVLDRFVGARAWSTSVHEEATRNPPAKPLPLEDRPGRSTSKRQSQQRFRAQVRIGSDVYDYDETLPSGEVTLMINGERSAIRRFDELAGVGLPDEVYQAIREARKAEIGG